MNSLLRGRRPTCGLRATRTALLVVCVLIATPACIATTGRTSDPFSGGGGGRAPGNQELRVEVENLNFNDVTAYAIRSGGQRIRVGRISGKTTQSFTLRWNSSIPIRFELDLLGAQNCRTQELIVNAGARLWVTIPNDTRLAPCRIGRR